jgi:SET domain-containing protein 6
MPCQTGPYVEPCAFYPLGTLANSKQALTAIIMSKSARPDSKWAPYFSVLPIELDSLVFWSASELAELQASAVVNKIGKRQAEDIFRDSISKVVPEGINLEFFHQVASTIMAYAFDIPEGNQDEEDNAQVDDLVDDEDEKTILAMIPLADMLNADADNNARLHYDGEELEMRAIKPIKSGEEILNDYGQLPRSDLLRRYGYVTDKYAIYDVAELSTSSIIAYARNDMYKDLKLRQTSAEIDVRLELATREDVYEDSYDIAHANDEWPCIPDELVALIWLLLIDKETIASIQSSEMSLPSRSKMETELVGKVLQALLKRREQEYATTASQDDALLQNANLTHRARMAIKVRQGEKTVLSEAMREAAHFQGSSKRMLGEAVKRGREEDDQKSQKRSKHR